MFRKLSLAAIALAALAAAAPASANPVVDTVNQVLKDAGGGVVVDDSLVERAEKTVNGEADKAAREVDEAVGGDAGGGRNVNSPVVGYVFISFRTALGETRPTFQAYGALADTTLWSCTDNFPALPYTVTCNPLPSTLLTWTCDVLHADMTGLGVTSRARTTMDCNNDGTPEAQTGIVIGPGHDFQWAPAAVPVTQFVCRVDGGSQPASPDYYGGCGDPGVPRVN